MSSFHDTVDLERAFLKAVTSSIIMARSYIHQGREEMFTSDPRKFIFVLATMSLNDANSLLTRQVYEYEVRSRAIDEADFIGEWNMIDGVSSADSPEALLAKIRDADTGRKALRLSEDAIDMLSKGRIKEAVAFLKREAMMIGGSDKGDRPMLPLSDMTLRINLYKDRLEHPEKYQGLKIGFPTFDKFTGGLFPGELTLIAGVTGLGKSTLCRAIARNIVTLNGAKNVLHVANEEYLEQVQYKYDALFMGFSYSDFKQARLSEDALDRWQKFMQKEMKESGAGQIFVKEVPAFTDVSLVEQQFRILENRGIPIHAIVIDHLPHVKPIEEAWGENDERFKAAVDCKELARALRVPVVTPTQAATEVEKKQTAGKRAGKLDVYGSKGQVHVANTFLIITYRGTDDTQQDLEDYLRDVYWLCDAKKNRDGPPFYFMAKHRVRDGFVEEIVDPSKKPHKEAADGVNSALAEAEGNDKAPTATALPAASNAPSNLNTGLRDAQMAFVEAIEGNLEGEDEVPAVSGLESQGIDSILSEAAGEVMGDINPPIQEPDAPKSMRDKIRAAKIPIPGV
jgi:replicative DNA helicase